MIPLPTFTNSLQLIGYVAILVYMAYGQWLTKEKAKHIKSELATATKITSTKIDDNTAKTDAVHDLLNSRLDKWKEEQMQDQELLRNKDLENHKLMLETAIDRLNQEHKATALADVTELHKRIASLENMINSMRPAMPPMGPTIAPLTPEERLSEIRGSAPK